MYFEVRHLVDNNIIFRYSDDSSCNLKCYKCFDGQGTDKSDKLNCYFFEKEENSQKYLFCLPRQQAKNTSIGNAYVKFMIQAYISLSSKPLNSSFPPQGAQGMYAKLLETSFHNTRTIASNIREKLFALLETSDEDFMRAEDKIDYVLEVVNRKEYFTARELLSILKSTEQILHEFTSLDFLHPNAKLSPKQMGDHKAHTVYVLSFYMYERDFADKHLHVKTGECDDKILIHFPTAKTAIAQILDNTIKYAKPNSKIDVAFSKETIDGCPYIALIFNMLSLAIEKNEISILMQQGKRSPHALRAQIPGSGQGLFVAKKMVELNGGIFSITTDDKIQKHQGIPYTKNTFKLYFKEFLEH